MIGTTISHFEIIEELGGGGMGMVYKAEDTKLKRTVVLKVLSAELTPDDVARKRFIQEAQAASMLDHVNICTIYEINSTPDGQIYIAMAYYPGQTLKERIRRGPMTLEEAADVVLQVGRGLVKSHSQGIIHRDIQPANIVLTDDGVAKILDFGLAKFLSRSALTRTGALLGTVAYMSPEQARGEQVGEQTDIWSLGVLFFELLTGQRPFQSDQEESLMYMIVREEPLALKTFRPDLPHIVSTVVQSCLAKSTHDRYKKMEELVADLSVITEAQAAKAPPFASRALRIRRNRILLAGAVGTVAVMVIAGFVWSIFFMDHSPPVSIDHPVSIAVVGFDNKTGDLSLDNLKDVIPNLLMTGLEQFPALRVTTWEHLRFLKRKRLSEAAPEDFYRFFTSVGISAVVSGEYSRAGQDIVLTVMIANAEKKKILKSVVEKSANAEDLVHGRLLEILRQILAAVGMPKEVFVEKEQSIAAVTARQISACGFYIKGRDRYIEGSAEAGELLQSAIRQDSSFADAYVWLAWFYLRNGRVDSAGMAITKARSLAWKAPEKEQLMIEGSYARIVEQNDEKVRHILSKMNRRFPQDSEWVRWMEERGH